MSYEQNLGKLVATTYEFMWINKRQNIDDKIYQIKKNVKSDVHKVILSALEEVEKTKRLSKYSHSKCNKMMSDLISKISGELLKEERKKTLNTEQQADFLLSYESSLTEVENLVNECFESQKQENKEGTDE